MSWGSFTDVLVSQLAELKKQVKLGKRLATGTVAEDGKVGFGADEDTGDETYDELEDAPCFVEGVPYPPDPVPRSLRHKTR